MKILGLILVVGMCVMATACDEIHSFQFVNQTAEPMTLTYQTHKSDSETVLDRGTYAIAPGTRVNTASHINQEGDHGASFFRDGLVLTVHAQSNGGVVLDRTFTYDELDKMGFTVVIGGDH
jgi:hypothetical protein